LHKHKILKHTLNIGLPDAFIEQGTREELLGLCGLDKQGLIRQIQGFVGGE
jgi:1-deoxy-D-xylulose-5-phosphate synthase